MRFLFSALLFLSVAASAQLRLIPGMKTPTGKTDIDLIPGMKMPEVSAEWINKPQKKTPTANQKQILILNFVDVLSPDIYQTLRLIESLEKKYASEPRAAVTVKTIAKNDVSLIRRILNADANPFTVAIGADLKGRTFRSFNTGLPTLPATFIAQNNAIAWNGHPIEIETVVDAILDNQFSISRQERIASLRKDLQSALKSGLPDVVAQTADKILAIAPNDAIAMQARLYAFELKGQTVKEAEFLLAHIRKHPKNSMRNRMLLLNLLLRTGNLIQWRAALDDTAKEAEKNPEDALNLTMYLVDRSPLGELPVAHVRKLSETALAGFRKNGRKESLADALEIAAKTQYVLCRLQNAVRFQKEAVELRRSIGSPFLKRAENILAFYEKLTAE